MSPNETSPEPRDEIGTERQSYEAPAWEVEKADEEVAMQLGCAKADNSCDPGPIQS